MTMMMMMMMMTEMMMTMMELQVPQGSASCRCHGPHHPQSLQVWCFMAGQGRLRV